MKFDADYRANFPKHLQHEHSVIRKELKAIQDGILSRDIKKKNNNEETEKLRIMIKESRMIYGICDQSGKLKYGQCFVRLTINGVPKVVTGKVLSARMPCYLPGDIR